MTRQLLINVEEYEQDLTRSRNAGYSDCLNHIKQIVLGGSVQISDKLDEETRNLWNLIIEKMSPTKGVKNVDRHKKVTSKRKRDS